MTGYTFMSGVTTTTVTSRCPVCLTVKVHYYADRNVRPHIQQLCCCDDHQALWTLLVKKLEAHAYSAHGYSKAWITTNITKREKRPGLLLTNLASDYVDTLLRERRG